jgi:trafficking protein particle complex subunit 11
MDAYPTDYVAHNLPLIFLCGLPSSSDVNHDTLSYPLLRENGYHLNLDLPTVNTPAAENLLRIFQDADARDGPWNSRNDTRRQGGVGFKIQSIGRVGQDTFSQE